MNTKRAKAMIEIGANPRGLDRGLADARKKMRGFASSMGKLGGGLAKGALGIGGKMLGGLGAGVGIGIAGGLVDSLAQAAGEVANYEMQLTRFQIAGGRTAAQMGEMRAAIDRVSESTAVSREQIIAGAASYVALTGDADGAAAAMESFARISQASGSEVADVATAAAALRDNLKLDPKQFEAAFSSLISQGKAGAVEVKDLAGELAALAPQFAQFKTMGGLEGVAELGASFQVVRKGFGDASQAATGLRSMMTAMVQNADKFEKAGVRIFDKDPKTGAKTMRRLSDIWGDINDSKLVKDPQLLGKAFGREEARRAYEMFLEHKDLYSDLIKAGQDYGTVQRDLNTVMESPAGKLQKSFNDMKNAIASAFTPERIAAFAEIMERVAKAAGWVLDKVDAIANLIDGTTIRKKMLSPLERGLKAQMLEEQYRQTQGRALLAGTGKQNAGGMVTYSDPKVAQEQFLRIAQAQQLSNPNMVIDTGMWGKHTAFENPLLQRDTRGPTQTQVDTMIANAIAKATIVLKVDENVLAKKQDNAVTHRAPTKGR